MRLAARFGWVRWMGSLVIVPVAAGVVHLTSCVNDQTGNTPCQTYCNDIATTCTGDDLQYKDLSTCTQMCAVMQPGTVGQGGADTIACRELNVSSAKDAPDGGKHANCVGGGPSASCCSGTVQQCQCQAFCDLEIALCTGANAQYQSATECTTACAAWGSSFDGALIGSTGNTLQCRTYHLELSQSGNPSDLATHCRHTGVVSATCGGSVAGDAGPDAAADAASD